MNKNKVNISTALPMDLGKIPPQAIDIEEAVLGAILLEKDALIKVVNILNPDSFYKEAHQKIYSAILNLFANRKPVDSLTVTEELRKLKQLEEIGGPYYISQLTQRIVSSANIEYHSYIVQQKYISRELIRISSEINTSAYDEELDVFDVINFASSQLIKLTENANVNSEVRLGDLIADEVTKIEMISTGKLKTGGLSSGLNKIDLRTNGWNKGDLIIVAGRPSMGKTALALKFILSPAILKQPAAFFSLEMDKSLIAKRYISCMSGYTNMELSSGKVDDWKRLEMGISKLDKLPIYIDDTPSLSIIKLKAKAYHLKNKYGIKILVIDYLQLMSGYGYEKGNRELEISNISRSLKCLAKELEMPVIALSQLNRSVESRPTKKPQLSDLRESGAIEQDADIVLFIYRPEYYGITEDEEGQSTKNQVVVITAKHRSGSTGESIIYKNNSMTDFYDTQTLDVHEFVNTNNSIKPNKNFNAEAFIEPSNPKDEVPF